MKAAGWWVGFLIATAFAHAVGIGHLGVGLPFVIGAIQSSPYGIGLGLIWTAVSASDGSVLLMRLAIVIGLFNLRIYWHIRPSIYASVLALVYGVIANDIVSAVGLMTFTYMVIRSGERKLESHLSDPSSEPSYTPAPKPSRQNTAVQLEHRPFDLY